MLPSVGALPALKSSFEYGRRMVLNPDDTIWSSMLCQLRFHSPWGANVPVSNPNQLTPVRVTSLPLASTNFFPTACRGPDSEWPGLAAALFTPADRPAPITDAATAIATTTDTTIVATRPRLGRFRNRLLRDANMILQKNHQQISDTGNFADAAAKSVIEWVP